MRMDDRNSKHDFIPVVVVLVLVAVDVIFLLKYGDKPVSELPAWIWWLFK